MLPLGDSLMSKGKYVLKTCLSPACQEEGDHEVVEGGPIKNGKW